MTSQDIDNLDQLIERFGGLFVEPVAKAALLKWRDEAVVAARQEQIMQDFMALEDLPDQYDEADQIAWREQQLKQLEGAE